MPKFGGASAPPSTHLSTADMPHILQFPKECLVFVDETGCAAKDQVRRKFGYSLRGEQTICYRQLVCGKRVSAIAAISLDGLLGVELLEQIAQATLPLSFVEL